MTYLDRGIRVGHWDLENRLVMAPVAMGKSDAGKVSPALLEQYDERTKGGYIGLVVIEHSFVRADGRANPNQLSAAEDADIPGLTALAQRVHANGSKVILQINHAGGAAKEGVTGQESISPSGIQSPFGALGAGVIQPARAMTQADIDEIIACFAQAAVRAQKAGFDGCEIHCAHGYLLNQFYSPLTNRRTDAYTGDTMEGRTRLPLQVIEAVRAAVGDAFLLSMRFGGCDYAPGGSTIAEAAWAARAYEEAGLDVLDVSGGLCFYTRKGHTESGYFSDLSQAVKQAVDIPVIVAGGVTTRQEAEALLHAQKADMIGVGRAIMQNPGWAKTAMSE